MKRRLELVRFDDEREERPALQHTMGPAVTVSIPMPDPNVIPISYLLIDREPDRTESAEAERMPD